MVTQKDQEQLTKKCCNQPSVTLLCVWLNFISTSTYKSQHGILIAFPLMCMLQNTVLFKTLNKSFLTHFLHYYYWPFFWCNCCMDLWVLYWYDLKLGFKFKVEMSRYRDVLNIYFLHSYLLLTIVRYQCFTGLMAVAFGSSSIKVAMGWRSSSTLFILFFR